MDPPCGVLLWYGSRLGYGDAHFMRGMTDPSTSPVGSPEGFERPTKSHSNILCRVLHGKQPCFDRYCNPYRSKDRRVLKSNKARRRLTNLHIVSPQSSFPRSSPAVSQHWDSIAGQVRSQTRAVIALLRDIAIGVAEILGQTTCAAIPWRVGVWYVGKQGG